MKGNPNKENNGMPYLELQLNDFPGRRVKAALLGLTWDNDSENLNLLFNLVCKQDSRQLINLLPSIHVISGRFFDIHHATFIIKNSKYAYIRFSAPSKKEEKNTFVYNSRTFLALRFRYEL